jgi:hypothetical protein
MQHIISVLGAVASLAVSQTAVATNTPVAVNACAVTDLVNAGTNPELGPPVSYRMLQLSFANMQPGDATQVTFDVLHAGTHTSVTDRGRFSQGVPIEHRFDYFAGGYGDGSAVCTVAAVTFADGTRWTPASARADRSPDRAFHPDYSRALTVDQMTRAWRDELDRIDPPVVTGGG